jgi:hypothetical protein
MTSKNIPRLSISDSSSPACFFSRLAWPAIRCRLRFLEA